VSEPLGFEGKALKGFPYLGLFLAPQPSHLANDVVVDILHIVAVMQHFEELVELRQVFSAQRLGGLRE
jgi:hypothetical protein